MTYTATLSVVTHEVAARRMLFVGTVHFDDYLTSAGFTAEFDLVGRVWKTHVASGNNEYIFSAIVAACAPHIPGEQA